MSIASKNPQNEFLKAARKFSSNKLSEVVGRLEKFG